MEIKGSSRENMPKVAGQQVKQLKTGDQAVAFADKLTRAGEKVWRDKLDVLLEKIQLQGKAMAKNRNLKELKRYKSLVKAFMQEAMEGSLKLKQNSSWNQWGKHRLLTIVEKIDEGIEELTLIMLSEEEKTMKILDKLDEIRGMLVDLYS